jgi:hypothetical protein
VLLALGEKGTPQVPFASSSGVGGASRPVSLSAPLAAKKVDYAQPSFSFNVTVTRCRWILKEVPQQTGAYQHSACVLTNASRLCEAVGWLGRVVAGIRID